MVLCVQLLEHLLPSLTPKDVRDLRLVEIFKSLANDSANNVRGKFVYSKWLFFGENPMSV